MAASAQAAVRAFWALTTAACALAANRSLHAALVAGAVYDQTLEKWMRHKQLINHPDPKIRALWNGGNEKEYGRLFQGFNTTKGKDVLHFIHKHEVPTDKTVTYPQCTAAYRPEKEDPYRVRITAGVDKLTYDGETATHAAGLANHHQNTPKFSRVYTKR